MSVGLAGYWRARTCSLVRKRGEDPRPSPLLLRPVWTSHRRGHGACRWFHRLRRRGSGAVLTEVSTVAAALVADSGVGLAAAGAAGTEAAAGTGAVAGTEGVTLAASACSEFGFGAAVDGRSPDCAEV